MSFTWQAKNFNDGLQKPIYNLQVPHREKLQTAKLVCVNPLFLLGFPVT